MFGVTYVNMSYGWTQKFIKTKLISLITVFLVTTVFWCFPHHNSLGTTDGKTHRRRCKCSKTIKLTILV